MATKKSYSEKLRDPRWQKKRLEILERDGWMCTMCNDKERELHIHHLNYTKENPHDELSENLISVCADCHFVIEFGKKAFPELTIIAIEKHSVTDRNLFHIKLSNDIVLILFIDLFNNILSYGAIIVNDFIKIADRMKGTNG
jgi:hypothetical protein